MMLKSPLAYPLAVLFTHIFESGTIPDIVLHMLFVSFTESI